MTSRTFSNSPQLRKELATHFPSCRFNDAGLKLAGRDLTEFLSGADGAIIGIEPLDRAIINNLPDLKIISKFGVGLDNIDLEALEEHGVFLALTSGVNAEAVAEHALLLILATLRRIPQAQINLQNRLWKSEPGQLLARRTVGLVGVGHVARKLVPLLQAFHCRILGFDSDPSPAHNVEFTTLHELLTSSDVVSLHLPSSPSTRKIIGPQELAMMKRGSVIINTSRGNLIDHDALVHALRSRHVAGAGLDVLDPEPPTDWKIMREENLFITPHLAGTSEETNLAMGRAAIRGFLEHRSIFTDALA